MLSYCFKCKKTDGKNQKVPKTNKRKFIIWSNCVLCYNKKLIFMTEKEVGGLLSSLGINTAFSQMPLVGPLFLKDIKWMKY